MLPSLQNDGRLLLACILALLHATSPAQTPAVSMHQEHARIDAQLKTAETACYQRFAVEDCLRVARHQARQAQDALRVRQHRLDEQERQQRAAQRLQTIQERQRNHSPTGVALSPAKATKAGNAANNHFARRPPAHRPTPAPAVVSAQRHIRQREAAQQAAQAQQRQRDKQAVAQEHKQNVQREQIQRAQSGKPTAAPLPLPK